MNFNGTKCDECARLKGESNHWHQIGVTTDGGLAHIELGELRGPYLGEERKYAVHDLCGEACFYKHLGKLLKLNPVSEGE